MMLAVIRIRGRRNLKPKIKKTMELLRLNRTQHCVLVNDTPQTKGMIGLIKDYVTFGAVDEAILIRLLTKRGKKGAVRLSQSMKEAEIADAAKKLLSGAVRLKDICDPVFTMRPPSKGYKDIKRPYPVGDLGFRADIIPLLKRML